MLLKSFPRSWRATLGLPPLLILVATLAQSEALGPLRDPPPRAAEPSIGATTPSLSLDEAVRLSLVDQPILTGHEALINASERQAIAAAQLPDPKLSGGLRDLPIDTGEAYSIRRDNFTEFTVGLSQEFPRAATRRLKGERKRLEGATERAALDNDRRAIRRDTALAWLDVYAAEQGLLLARRLTGEAAFQLQSLQKDYAVGRASQAEWSSAMVDVGLAQDKEHDWLHQVQRMRAGLARWIGEDSERPLSGPLPSLPPPDVLPVLLAAVDHHPVLSGLDAQIDASATDVALARQAYKPDFAVEGYIAYRPGFSDFVGIQVSVGLPYFTKNRQDPEVAAAFERSRFAKERRRDLVREIRARVSQDSLDWHHYRERLGEFDTVILPVAARRIEEARGAYQAGRGGFDTVLAARRGLVEIEQQRITLAVEAVRAQVRLQYFAAAADGVGETP